MIPVALSPGFHKFYTKMFPILLSILHHRKFVAVELAPESHSLGLSGVPQIYGLKP